MQEKPPAIENPDARCYSCGGEGGDDVRLCPKCIAARKGTKNAPAKSLLEIIAEDPQLGKQKGGRLRGHELKLSRGPRIALMIALLVLVVSKYGDIGWEPGEEPAPEKPKSIFHQWDIGLGEKITAVVEPWPPSASGAAMLIVKCAFCSGAMFDFVEDAEGFRSMRKGVNADGGGEEYFWGAITLPPGNATLQVRALRPNGDNSEVGGWLIGSK